MDEPWDGPNNRQLADEIYGVFSCPSYDSGNGETNNTNYCLVTGLGTLFESDRAPEFVDIKDGSSNTAILVEVNHGEIHWMEPRDLTLDEVLGIFEKVSGGDQNGNHPGIQNVAHADGSTHSLSTSTEGNDLLKLFLIADESGKQNESDEIDD